MVFAVEHPLQRDEGVRRHHAVRVGAAADRQLQPQRAGKRRHEARGIGAALAEEGLAAEIERVAREPSHPHGLQSD